VQEVEEKITKLQKEVKNLITNVSDCTPKEDPPAATINEQISQTAPASVLESMPSVILRCAQWEDFQALAMHAQTLTFCYKEDLKVFQANALKGNQLIIYDGAFPNFSMILTKWLSLQLDITKPNIVEGTLDNLKKHFVY
jgi:hypothetical protein